MSSTHITRSLQAILFAAVVALANASLAQLTIIPDTPTKAGTDTLQILSPNGAILRTYTLNLNGNETKQQKEQLWMQKLQMGGENVVPLQEGFALPNVRNFQYQDNTGEKRNRAYVSEAAVQVGSFQGQPTGTDSQGNPAAYVMGLEAPGVDIEIELLPPMLPPNFGAFDILQQFEFEMQQQLPPPLQPGLFIDPFQNLVFDGIDLIPPTGDPWGIIFGTTDTGLDAFGSLFVPQLPPLCDFNGDLSCDIVDLQFVYEDIAAGLTNVPTDVDGNGVVNNDDIPVWLDIAGAHHGEVFLPGDTDLSGSVGGNDFTIVASNFGETGLPNAFWHHGNFNGNANGVFDVGGSDFTQLAANFGFNSVQTSAVPEPNTMVTLLVGLLASLGGLRRK